MVKLDYSTSRTRKWCLLFLIMNEGVLSSRSWLTFNPIASTTSRSTLLESTSSSLRDKHILIKVPSHHGTRRLYSKINDEKEEEDSGLWNRYFGSDKKKKKRSQKGTSSSSSNKGGNEPSLLQGMMGRFRDSRKDKKAEKEQALAEKLAKKIEEDNMLTSLFNTSYLTGAFEKLEGEMGKIRKDLTRTTPVTEEERKLQELRRQQEVERRRKTLRVEAKWLADKKEADEKLQKAQELAAEQGEAKRKMEEQMRKRNQQLEEERKRLEAIRQAEKERRALTLKLREEQSRKLAEDRRKKEEAARERRIRNEAIRKAAKAKAEAAPNQRTGTAKGDAKPSSFPSFSFFSKNEEKKEEEGVEGKTVSQFQKIFGSLFESSKSKKDEEWIAVAPKWAIAPGQIVPITSAGLDLLLVASKDGSSLHCVANSCPHLGTPLETGMLDRRPIEIPDQPTTSSSSSAERPVEISEETVVANLLAQDGCEDCIVCPLHRTAFALESGEVRGEWCPYPPVLGNMMGSVKKKAQLPVFDVRTKGKNIEVRLNSPVK